MVLSEFTVKAKIAQCDCVRKKRLKLSVHRTLPFGIKKFRIRELKLMDHILRSFYFYMKVSFFFSSFYFYMKWETEYIHSFHQKIVLLGLIVKNMHSSGTFGDQKKYLEKDKENCPLFLI